MRISKSSKRFIAVLSAVAIVAAMFIPVATAPAAAVDTTKYFSVNMFDYNQNTINAAVKKISGMTNDKAFVFTGSGTNMDNRSSVSAYTGRGNGIVTGLVANTLTNGKLNYNTGICGIDLFDTASQNYTSYTNVQFPFNYNAATGMYSYDSTVQSATYNNGTVTLGAANGGFWPFDTGSGHDYHFGMNFSTLFYIPENKKIGDSDIVFNFSGDDDMWVFIDGQLVLDIGGIHDAFSGSINFTNGNVTTPKTFKNYTSSGSLTDVKGTGSTTAVNSAIAAFSANSVHTMTVFYLERGAGDSNCKIEFNMPNYEPLTVEKKLGNVNSGVSTNENFTFKLETNPSANSNYTTAATPFTLYNADGTHTATATAADGTFSIRTGQKAVFDTLLINTYFKVTEVGGADYDTAFSTPSWAKSSTTTTAKSIESKLVQDPSVEKGAYTLSCTNNRYTTPVTFTKVDNNNAAVAGAEFSLTGTSSRSETVNAAASSDANGNVTFTGIPAGTYTLTETSAPEQYNASSDTHTVYVVQNSDNSFTVTFDGDTATSLEVVNTVKTATYSVEYYFETGYHETAADKVYAIDDSMTLSDQSMTYGETKNASDFNGVDVSASHPGYTYSDSKTTSDGYTQVTYDSANRVIKLYYDFTRPADKTYNVRYYFQNGYGSAEYTEDTGLESLNNTIAYDSAAVTASAYSGAETNHANYVYDASHSGAVNSLAYADITDTNNTLTLYYMAPKPVTIKYWFEQNYNAGDYAQNLTGYPDVQAQILYNSGAAESTANYLLSNLTGYSLDETNTESGKQITYDSADSELNIYYKLPKPDDKTFSVEHYYETAYNSNTYEIKPEYGTTDNISYGETKTDASYKRTDEGYTYAVIEGSSVQSISYDSESRVLKLYYRKNIPADKTYNVEYYLEKTYNSGVYELKDSATGAIAFGATKTDADADVAKTFTGYTFTTVADSIGTITYSVEGQTDGLTLKLYYKLDKPADRTYTVEFYKQETYGGTKYNIQPDMTKTNLPISYGQTVSASAYSGEKIAGATYSNDVTEHNGYYTVAFSDEGELVLRLYYTIDYVPPTPPAPPITPVTPPVTPVTPPVTPVTPTPTPVTPDIPDTTVDIDTPDVPLAPAPETTAPVNIDGPAAVDPTSEPDETVIDIPVEDVPRAETPADTSEPTNTSEPDVPLDNTPDTGDNSMLWLPLSIMLAALAGILIALTAGYARGKRCKH